MKQNVIIYICSICVVVMNRFYNCEITHEKIQCKICSSFLSGRYMTSGFYNVSQQFSKLFYKYIYQ